MTSGVEFFDELQSDNQHPQVSNGLLNVYWPVSSVGFRWKLKDFAELRRQAVAELKDEGLLKDPNIIRAMEKVPRRVPTPRSQVVRLHRLADTDWLWADDERASHDCDVL